MKGCWKIWVSQVFSGTRCPVQQQASHGKLREAMHPILGLGCTVESWEHQGLGITSNTLITIIITHQGLGINNNYNYHV